MKEEPELLCQQLQKHKKGLSPHLLDKCEAKAIRKTVVGNTEQR